MCLADWRFWGACPPLSFCFGSENLPRIVISLAYDNLCSGGRSYELDVPEIEQHHERQVLDCNAVMPLKPTMLTP
jgi:hypothetical protein